MRPTRGVAGQHRNCLRENTTCLSGGMRIGRQQKIGQPRHVRQSNLRTKHSYHFWLTTGLKHRDGGLGPLRPLPRERIAEVPMHCIHRVHLAIPHDLLLSFQSTTIEVGVGNHKHNNGRASSELYGLKGAPVLVFAKIIHQS